VSYASSSRAVLINLPGQITADGVNTDTLSSIEHATGSAFNDTIIGDDNANLLDGGSDGSDHIEGGGGSDTVGYASSTRAVLINLGAQLTADGVNTDTLSSIEHAIGSAFDDTILGDAGPNTLQGALGSDTLWGLGGEDTFLFGSPAEGVDRLATSCRGSTTSASRARSGFPLSPTMTISSHPPTRRRPAAGRASSTTPPPADCSTTPTESGPERRCRSPFWKARPPSTRQTSCSSE